MGFPGFTDDDFAVFDLPGFAERMTAIRERVRPKLTALGEAATPWLNAATGRTFFPHVALHARRTVNPPDDTWVAFGPSPRGYKRYGHFAVGIRRSGVYVRFVLKAEADDKLVFHDALRREGARILGSLEGWRDYRWYETDHPGPGDGRPIGELSDADVRATAAALLRKRTATLAVGTEFPADHPTLRNGPAFVAQAVEIMDEMLPLYLAAAGTGPVDIPRGHSGAQKRVTAIGGHPEPNSGSF